jgi:hypothetical protein
MRRALPFLLATLAWPAAAGAQSFADQDWQVVCDNTRTCRAAGYQHEGDANAVSLLLTRAAGPGATVTGELLLGDMGRGGSSPASLKLTIAGKPAGTIAIDRARHRAPLGGSVVEALLRALPGAAPIALSAGKTTWRLSGDGAAAMLLKMDELQGRVGTASALVRRGTLGSDNVLLPLSVPTLQAVRIAGPARPGDDALASLILSRIPHADDCPALDDVDTARDPANAPKVWHLDANRVLLRAACGRSAGSQGDGFWIAIVHPPYDAKRLTASGTGFDGVATLSAQHKDRELGDCVTDEAWTWNGYAFEATSASTSGLCREVAVGGAWNLPTLVTQVIPAK